MDYEAFLTAILLRAQSRVAESFCDALMFLPRVFVHDVSSRASR